MNNFFKKIFILGGLGLAALLLAGQASQAQAAEIGVSGVTYPIAELGNCRDQADCAVYCDNSGNMLACVNYADNNGLIDKTEAALAKKAIVKIQSGQTPGGCNSQESCQNYCQTNAANLNSCIAFSEEIGVPAAELEQAKKIAAALKGGAKMPGGCGGKQACEAYCQDISHIDECLTFAEEAQILPAEEIAEAKKVAPFLKNGQTPGGCKSKNECRAYCDAETNFSVCINFAETAGFVSADEAALAKKTGGKGPGGCKSKQSCEAYCGLPANAKACAEFALQKGLVDDATAEKIKNGYKEIQAGLEKTPAEIRPGVENCLNNLFNGNLAGVLAGGEIITKIQGEKIGGCFEAAAKKYADDQARSGAATAAGAIGQGQGGQSGPPSNLKDMEKSLDSAPPEIQQQVKEEIERQKQQAMEEEIKQNIQSNTPANAPSGMPSNIPANIPAGIPTDLPASQAPGQPSAGVQGAPCGSPAECQAMFSGGPPDGISGR